jgi:hypothetical protein
MNNSLPSAPEEFLQMALSSQTPNEVDAVLRIAQEKGIPLNTQLRQGIAMHALELSKQLDKPLPPNLERWCRQVLEESPDDDLEDCSNH